MPFTLTELEERYPNLYQLIGGYFHQDWSDEYGGSPQAALDDYRTALGPEAAGAAREIDAALARYDDAEIDELLDRLGNSYAYDIDGYTARTWLEAIRKRLSEAT